MRRFPTRVGMCAHPQIAPSSPSSSSIRVCTQTWTSRRSCSPSSRVNSTRNSDAARAECTMAHDRHGRYCQGEASRRSALALPLLTVATTVACRADADEGFCDAARGAFAAASNNAAGSSASLQFSVGQGALYPSINAALAAAPPGSTVNVTAGRYVERLLLDRPVKIQSSPMMSSQHGEVGSGTEVTVAWETDQPYQSTIQCNTGGIQLIGLTIQHYSKSVANNYGVLITAGDAVLVDCCVTSHSGSGIGIEAAAPKLVRCNISHCASHGVAIFGGGGLVDEDDWASRDSCTAGGLLQDCTITSNGGDGVLIRGSGAAPRLLANTISSNQGYGIEVQDCGGTFEGNKVMRNRRGDTFLKPGYDAVIVGL